MLKRLQVLILALCALGGLFIFFQWKMGPGKPLEQPEIPVRFEEPESVWNSISEGPCKLDPLDKKKGLMCFFNRYAHIGSTPHISAMPLVVMGSDRAHYLRRSIGALCDCFGMNKDENLVIVSLDRVRNDTVDAINSVLSEKDCPFQVRIIFHENQSFQKRDASGAKMHWWWLMHQIFEEKYLLGDYKGDVLFLEDDHAVSQDAYMTSVFMSELKNNLSSTLSMWGTALSRDAMPALPGEVDPNQFVVIRHNWPPCPNMGYSFNHTLWSLIKRQERHFLHAGDFFIDWDNTIGHLMQRCLIPNVIVRPVITRLLHIGVNGLIDQAHYNMRRYNETQLSNLSPSNFSISRFHWSFGHNADRTTCDDHDEKFCWNCKRCRICNGSDRNHYQKLLNDMSIETSQNRDGTVPKRVRGITLVTHLSHNRIHNLKAILLRWKGPIVATIYHTPRATRKIPRTQTIHKFLSSLQKRLSLSPADSDRLHLVAQPTLVIDNETLDYPVNHLRNMGLAHAKTELVFMLDADFIPSRGLYEALLGDVYDQIVGKQVALAIPAFEIPDPNLNPKPLREWADKIDRRIPSTKEELVRSLQNNEASIAVPWLPQSHENCLNYSWWLNETSTGPAEAYEVRIPVRFECEPYVVLDNTIAPLFDESFLWYGADKQHYIALLGALRYRFLVLTKQFVVHVGHPSAPWSWRTEQTLEKIRKQMAASQLKIYQIGQQLLNNNATANTTT